MTPQEQIKEKLDLVDLVGAYVQLKNAGSGNMKGLCPFHSEKSPSFNVSRDKQFWHCFGCNLGGDHFDFVMRMEGLDFPEALRLLAERAGVEIPRYSTKEANEKTRLFEILKLAERYYAKCLAESPYAETARAYVEKRVIPQPLVDRFGIGYAPESWDALGATLAKHGFKEDEIVAAGLAAKRQQGSGTYDRFRDRLMFPIRDQNGRTVGFTGRVLKADAKEAKYVNTPQSQMYDKSAVLFGLDLAKKAIRDKGFVVLVEGQMDVVGSWRGGVENVVASSGTALTDRQVGLLKRFTSMACIAFDADAAGLNAARRGIDLLLAAEMDVKIITLPAEYKDPDELTVKDPAAWQKAVAEAKHMVAFEIERAKLAGLEDPLVKKQSVKLILDDIRKLRDPVERDHWLQVVAKECAVDIRALQEALGIRNSIPQKTAPATMRIKPIAKNTPQNEQLSELILGIFLSTNELRLALAEKLKPEMFHGDWKTLYTELFAAYTESLSAVLEKSTEISPSALYERLQNSDRLEPPTRALLSRAIMVAADAVPRDPTAQNEFFQTITNRFIGDYLKRRRLEVENALREAESRNDAVAVGELMSEFQKLGRNF